VWENKYAIRKRNLPESQEDPKDESYGMGCLIGTLRKTCSNEVNLVGLDVIRFLATCQTEGISLVHCSRYINNWIAQERFSGQ
jgi:hypothetical protein